MEESASCRLQYCSPRAREKAFHDGPRDLYDDQSVFCIDDLRTDKMRGTKRFRVQKEGQGEEIDHALASESLGTLNTDVWFLLRI